MSEEQEGQDLPERWSAGRKTAIVLRLLRMEDLGAVSREVQVPPQELEDWRRVFLECGARGLKRSGRDATERELIRTRAKVGELMMKLELTTGLLEKRGYADDLKKLTRSREP